MPLRGVPRFLYRAPVCVGARGESAGQPASAPFIHSAAKLPRSLVLASGESGAELSCPGSGGVRRHAAPTEGGGGSEGRGERESARRS